ncbi:unnamed protein product [Phytomonas sp. EM1]|nr:unnamed protein product [Phytomonas sp. EM1]|eukprot:CCW65024.1 unnamed protein product [Phytomonas sp. isolate EM1]
MPLDYVGKLHRTVYFCHCAEEDREDLLRLLLQRCGAIEAWDVIDQDRLAVIFAKVDSVSNALSFHGLSFVNMETRLVVWKATEAPPPEASTQLAIAAPSTGGGGGGELIAGDDAVEARRARREARQQRLDAIKTTLHAEVARSDYSNPAIRAAKLRELSFRQLRALCVLTKRAIHHAEEELASKKSNLAMIHSLLASLPDTGVKGGG